MKRYDPNLLALWILRLIHLLCLAGVCTPKKLLHQATFTSEDPYIRNRIHTNLHTRSLLHHKQFEPKNFYSRNNFHQTTSTTEGGHTRTTNLFHQSALTPNCFYTPKAFTPEPQNPFSPGNLSLYTRSPYTRNPSHKQSCTLFTPEAI